MLTEPPFSCRPASRPLQRPSLLSAFDTPAVLSAQALRTHWWLNASSSAAITPATAPSATSVLPTASYPVSDAEEALHVSLSLDSVKRKRVYKIKKHKRRKKRRLLRMRTSGSDIKK